MAFLCVFRIYRNRHFRKLRSTNYEDFMLEMKDNPVILGILDLHYARDTLSWLGYVKVGRMLIIIIAIAFIIAFFD